MTNRARSAYHHYKSVGKLSYTDDCRNISTDFYGKLRVRFRCRSVVAVVWMSKRQIEIYGGNII